MSPDEEVYTDLEKSEVPWGNDPEIDIESTPTASPEETDERVDTDLQKSEVPDDYNPDIDIESSPSTRIRQPRTLSYLLKLKINENQRTILS